MKLWQLKKISTNSALNEPAPLPENWGPIFGLSGIKERLGDLSWLGDDYKDMGWFEVGEIDDPVTQTVTEDPAKHALRVARELLQQSDWAVLPDVPMTNGQKTAWLEYRKALREVNLQVGFPNNIHWPNKPQ